ncbi:MAG: META domain-containing protein [Flavobacteriaceae bacterium]|jgi:heat shock protein HslJ|nr:META domain-containing protein [Flavobacteriaceae bacterium]
MKKLLLIFVLAILASCSSVPKNKTKTQPSLLNTNWTLAETLRGKKIPTLSIENGRISGNAGCNNYFGEVLLDPTTGNFSVSKVGSTKMACDNMSIEDNFLKLLSQVNKYAVNGNALELYKDDLLLMKFNKN